MKRLRATAPDECEFEAEVLAAALQSRWPDRVDSELRAHASSCAVCTDVAAVASAMEAAREEICSAAVLPDSGRVWWLAQRRAQREAATAAGRPITAIQVLSLACAVGLLGACFGATSPWFQLMLASITAAVQGWDVKAFLSLATALLARHAAVVVTTAAVLVVVPAAVYLVIARE